MTIQTRIWTKTDRAIKQPARVATTANVTLSGLQTIDGVALAADDRVLVKNQTSTAENGIYYAGTGAWERAPDWGISSRFYNVTVVPGTQVLVTEGDTNGGTCWYVATANVINPSTIQTTFARLVARELVARVEALEELDTERVAKASDTTAGKLWRFTDTAGGLGQSQMVETSAGNVGIGTASPAYPLDVVGDAGKTILRVSDGANGAFTVSFSPTYGVELGSTTGSPVALKAYDVVGLVIEVTGQPRFVRAPKLPSYTVSGVPSASTLGAGSLIHVSNETGGAVVAFSDGTNWRRVTDRIVVS